MRRFALLWVCLIIVAATAFGQVNVGQVLPTEQAVARYGLTRRWYAFAPVDSIREAIQNVSVVGNQLHLQTNSSRIHVMDGETGKLLWSAQMGSGVPGQFGSAMNSNSVFVISGSKLYRLDRDDGSLLWSVRLPHAPNAAPSADDNRVTVSTIDGQINVYSVNNKERLWYYKTNGPISIPAAMVDDKIACASQDGKMYVFQSTNRNPTVRYQTSAPVSAPMAVWGRAVLLPSQDFNLYAVDVRNGDTLWRYSSGSEIHRPVSVIDNDVYVAPEDGGLHALNAETGVRSWRHPRAQEFVAASKTRVYAADRYGQLVILDRANGRQIDTWNVNEFMFRVRNEENDRIYLVTKNGLVVCLHEEKNVTPLIHQKVMPPPPAGLETKKPGDDTASY
jgi:outer membrane protein assembly factor BamB